MRKIALFLCVFLLICMVPINAMAAEDVYIAGYSVSVASWVRDYNTEDIPRADVSITITDNRLLEKTDFGQVKVTATPHSGSFDAGPVSTEIDSNSFTLTFSNVAYLGGEAVFSFDLAYEGLRTGFSEEKPDESTDSATEQIALENTSYTLPSITLSQLIGQCRTIEKEIAPPKEPEKPKEPKVYQTPQLQIKSAAFDKNAVPGEAVKLSVTVISSSGNEHLSDVWVQIALPNGLTAVNGVTGTSLGEVGAEATRVINFDLLVDIDASVELADIAITVSGRGKESGTASNVSGSAHLITGSVDRFELLRADLPDNFSTDSENAITVECVNKGRQTVYNVTATLCDAAGKEITSQYIGNVDSGQLVTTSIPVTATERGEIIWNLEILYETHTGTAKVLRRQLQTIISGNVQNDAMDSPITQIYDMVDREDSKQPPFWCWALLITVCVAAVIHLILGWMRSWMEHRRYLRIPGKE